MANRTFSHTAIVTAFEKPRLFEWRFEDGYGVQGTERWELERLPKSAGPKTMIRFTDEYRIPGPFGQLIDWLLTRHALARRNRDYLDRLARLAERRPSRG
jgi:hypothetical protein